MRVLLLCALLLPACLARAEVPWTDAVVIKVDLPRQRLHLKSAALAHLDMPPMTMGFLVAEPQWLRLRPQQPVRVQLDKVNGAYTVLALTLGPAPAAPRD